MRRTNRSRQTILIFVAFSFATLNGCAEYVSFVTYPPGATVYIEDKPVGTTPVEYRVKRSNIAPLRYRINKPNYAPVEGTLQTAIAPGRAVGAGFTLGIVYLFRSPYYIKNARHELTPALQLPVAGAAVSSGLDPTAPVESFAEPKLLAAMSGARVVVLPFLDDSMGGTSSVSWQYTDEWSLFLRKLGRFTLVERARVESILASEGHFGDASGLKIGKALQAKGVFLGSVGAGFLSVRLVEAESGAEVWSARITGRMDHSSAADRRVATGLLVSTLARARLGFVVKDNTEDRGDSEGRGVVVGKIETASRAQAAGLQPGDVIYKANGKRIADALDLRAELLGRNPGDVIMLAVRRSVPGGSGEANHLDIPVQLVAK